MKKLFLLFFLVSCASPNLNDNTINKTFDFNKDLNFNEFNQLLIRYAETSPYPDINK